MSTGAGTLNLPMETPFLLQYHPEPGFLLASRTPNGMVELAGGALNYLSGKTKFSSIRYAARDSATSRVEALHHELAKPANLLTAGHIPLSGIEETLEFLLAIAAVCSCGRRNMVPVQWRSAAEPLLNAILPNLLQLQVVRDDEARASSRYDW